MAQTMLDDPDIPLPDDETALLLAMLADEDDEEEVPERELTPSEKKRLARTGWIPGMDRPGRTEPTELDYALWGFWRGLRNGAADAVGLISEDAADVVGAQDLPEGVDLGAAGKAGEYLGEAATYFVPYTGATRLARALMKTRGLGKTAVGRTIGDSVAWAGVDAAREAHRGVVPAAEAAAVGAANRLALGGLGAAGKGAQVGSSAAYRHLRRKLQESQR